MIQITHHKAIKQKKELPTIKNKKSSFTLNVKTTAASGNTPGSNTLESNVRTSRNSGDAV